MPDQPDNRIKLSRFTDEDKAVFDEILAGMWTDLEVFKQGLTKPIK